MQKKPAFVPDSEAFNSFIGDGLQGPELKGGSGTSEDDQAHNVSNEALYVIGLHGSDDKISRYLPDWEVAKEVGDVVGLVFERACRPSDKPL